MIVILWSPYSKYMLHENIWFGQFIWKQDKLLAGTRQIFGLELEGKAAKLLMMTLAYCSTCG